MVSTDTAKAREPAGISSTAMIPTTRAMTVDRARDTVWVVPSHHIPGARAPRAVTAQDPKRPEYGSIQLKFTGNPVELRQWVIDDGNGNTTEGTVNVTVNPVNDAPVANDDSASTTGTDPVVIDVLANDTDVDGDGAIFA